MTNDEPSSELPDFNSHEGVIRVVKRPIPVSVTIAEHDGIIETLEGRVTFLAGDAIMTGVNGEHWPIERTAFLASYDPVTPTEQGTAGIYVKRPQTVLALRLDKILRVPVGRRPDPLIGYPGDWLLRYPDASYGIIHDEIFRETYEVIP